MRALKYNGGVPKTELADENLEALKAGIVNLKAHIENMRKYKVPVVVAINRFQSDSGKELELIEETCQSCGAEFALTEVFAQKAGNGGKELAFKVVEACEKPSDFTPIYPDSMTIEEKIAVLAREIYGADGVTYTAAAKKALKEIQELGGDRLPVCVAKTQVFSVGQSCPSGQAERFSDYCKRYETV